MSNEIAAYGAGSWPQARALTPSALFWTAMLAASAFGTNLGDFWADKSTLSLAHSAALLGVASLLLIFADRWRSMRGEAYFWITIVILRAMATNIGDFLTDDLGIVRPVSTLALGAATLAAGWFTTRGRSPDIDARYWLAMALGGVFGTVGGDLVSHEIGLPVAAIALGALIVAAIGLREALAPAAALGYWIIVLTERTAGTAVGDLFAEERGLSLGLPVAMAITGGATLLALAARARAAKA